MVSSDFSVLCGQSQHPPRTIGLSWILTNFFPLHNFFYCSHANARLTCHVKMPTTEKMKTYFPSLSLSAFPFRVGPQGRRVRGGEGPDRWLVPVVPAHQRGCEEQSPLQVSMTLVTSATLTKPTRRLLSPTSKTLTRLSLHLFSD